jgi:hypothetical protein
MKNLAAALAVMLGLAWLTSCTPQQAAVVDPGIAAACAVAGPVLAKAAAAPASLTQVTASYGVAFCNNPTPTANTNSVSWLSGLVNTLLPLLPAVLPLL